MKLFNTLREDTLEEKLKASDPAGKYIHDFVHSDNPKFAGKSKKKRIQMALAASYAAKRATKTDEEVELDEGIGDTLKAAGKKILQKLGHGSDEDMRKDLQKKMGVPQTGKKPTSEGVYNKDVEKSFPASGVKTGASAPNGTSTMPKDANKARGMPAGKVGEEVELDEDEFDRYGSHSSAVALKLDRVKRARAMMNDEEGQKKPAQPKPTQPTQTEEVELDEAGMPSSVIKSKQRYANMTPAKFAEAHGNKTDEELKKMAWRHGYGEGSMHYVNKRNEGMPKEEVEQIDELKKSTIGSYVKKASHSATINNSIANDFKNIAKKARKTSAKKAATELADKYQDKSWKRKAGVNKAVDRLTKEEAELDEGRYGSRDAYQRDYDSSRTGFGRRPREDDEYHNGPDPEQHVFHYKVSKDGGEQTSRKVTTGMTTRPRHEMEKFARAHLEKQGYKIHEEFKLREDRYDDMLDAMLKGKSGKRLLAKHSAEVQRHKDIESGKTLKQYVKKNPGVLKTHSNAVKKDKKMYGEEAVNEINMTAHIKRQATKLKMKAGGLKQNKNIPFPAPTTTAEGTVQDVADSSLNLIGKTVNVLKKTATGKDASSSFTKEKDPSSLIGKQ